MNRSLEPITEGIKNKVFSPAELDYIEANTPKEAKLELQRAYEKTVQP